MRNLKKLKFIEPPRKEVLLEENNLSVLFGGDNCSVYKNGTCTNYDNGSCSGGAGATFKCGSYALG